MIQYNLKIIQGNLDLLEDREKFVGSLVEGMNMKEEETGFSSKEDLKNFIRDFVFGNFSGRYDKKELDKGKAEEILSKTLKFCSTELKSEKINIYIFPTYSDFTMGKMGGVNGFCIGPRLIFIGLYPSEKWEKNLANTIIHELAHSISDFYDMSKLSIGEGIIFDGLAENFIEHLGKTPGPWAKSLSKKESLKIFQEIKIKLDKRDFNLYSKVFFGTGKYPLWSGYSIGYHLIKDYIKSKKRRNWNKILRENPNKILKEIKSSI